MLTLSAGFWLLGREDGQAKPALIRVALEGPGLSRTAYGSAWAKDMAAAAWRTDGWWWRRIIVPATLPDDAAMRLLPHVER